MTAISTRATSALAKRPGVLIHLGLALVAYVPFLASSPGDVAADTKQYLYLDPGRLLRGAAYLWDPNFGAGTVPHQNIGYLFPMGPYYWLMEQLGVPDWVAQRLWLGTVTFAAGAGVLFLLRTLQHRDGGANGGAIAASLVYMLSPYVLAYTARQSVILLPWAGLPWMIALAERSLRTPNWKHPAIFALVAFTVGGTNATALLFAGIGPVLWIVFAVVVERRVTARVALAVTGRIGLLVALTAAWWVSALSIQGRYGIPVLDYTETVRAVAAASSPIEVLRGLGNWFFYGRDGLSEWVSQSPQYQEELWLIVATLLIPVLAFAAAALTRWRHRAFFVALIVIGVVIAVGTYPYDDSSPVGRVFKSFAEGSSVGLAMRSTPRAVPLVALGVAVLLGAGVSALLVHRWRVGLAAAIVVGLLAVISLPPAWSADYVGDNLKRSEDVPQYWLDAAQALDATTNDTRVLELPGADFSAYRWGNTVDPILPGLMERPWVERELVPFGSQASADLLIALDRRFQEGVAEPEALAAIARLFAAGDVVVRYDLEYERYRTPRPRLLYAALVPRTDGLEAPDDYGPRSPNRAAPGQPMLDAIELGTPTDAAEPPKVQIFGVEDPQSIVRTAPLDNPVIVAGSGEGLVDAAAAGVIDGRTIVFSSASYAKHPGALRKLLARDADLIVTDTNRRRVRHWGGSRDQTGYTEQVGEESLVEDPADQRLDVFPDEGDDSRTITELRGVESVQATTYGDPLLLTPENRPAMAFDDDTRTAWVEGAGIDAEGERLVVRLNSEVTADRLTLVQPQHGQRDRYITDVSLRFDDRPAQHLRLGDESRKNQGETVHFTRQTFRQVEITIDAVESPTGGKSAVGFAEVRIPGVRVREVVRMPVDLGDVAGADSQAHRLTYLMTRLRTSQSEYLRTDEELSLVREFDVPTTRQFAVSGTARFNGRASEEVLEPLLRTCDTGCERTLSSSYLEGDLHAMARAAFDHDLNTAWTPSYGPSTGEWLAYERPGGIDPLDHLDLEIVSDGRHSVPTRLRIEADDAQAFEVSVPPIADQARVGTTTAVTVQFPEIAASRLRVTVAEVRPVTTIEFFSRTPIQLPIAIAEIAIPGASTMTLPPELAETVATLCRNDLLTIDGQPIEVGVVSSFNAAIDREALTLQPCGASADGISLAAGPHVLEAAKGLDTGIDLDRIALASDASGAPRVDPLLGQSGGQQDGPDIRIADEGRTSYDLRVRGADGPFWLVLGQSHNDGWRGELADGTSLGEPDLVDGMANAWLVDPGDANSLSITLSWTPQRRVWLGLGITALGVLACLVIIVRRRKDVAEPEFDEPPELRLEADDDVWTSQRVRIGLPIAAAIVGAVIGAPWVGVVAGLATLGALVDRRARTAVRFAAGVVLAVTAGYVIVQQARNGYPAAFDWPQRFLRVNDWPMLAIVLLASTVAIDAVAEQEAG